MNLIEQLGGYENAKDRLKRENVLNYGDYKYGRDQLLKYRRENNIFEVGDKVIFEDAEIYTEELSIYKIVEILNGGEVVLSDGECLDPTIIAHATPEEIQAGRRL